MGSEGSAELDGTALTQTSPSGWEFCSRNLLARYLKISIYVTLTDI